MTNLQNTLKSGKKAKQPKVVQINLNSEKTPDKKLHSKKVSKAAEIDEQIDDPEMHMRSQPSRQMEFRTKNDLRESEGNPSHFPA